MWYNHKCQLWLLLSLWCRWCTAWLDPPVHLRSAYFISRPTWWSHDAFFSQERTICWRQRRFFVLKPNCFWKTTEIFRHWDCILGFQRRNFSDLQRTFWALLPYMYRSISRFGRRGSFFFANAEQERLSDPRMHSTRRHSRQALLMMMMIWSTIQNGTVRPISSPLVYTSPRCDTTHMIISAT